jgi:hypothetical protein
MVELFKATDTKLSVAIPTQAVETAITKHLHRCADESHRS